MAIVNNLIGGKTLKNIEEYIRTGTGGEDIIDLHGWLMYIPLGVEKYAALK